MITKKYFFLLFFFLSLSYTPFCISSQNSLMLKDNLQNAQAGDYLVSAQNKNYTMLLIRNKDNEYLTLEEITVPITRIPQNKGFSWRNWISERAPKHTSWLMYRIHLPTGTLQQAYSFTKNSAITIPQSQNFLSTLLNLRLQQIPHNERKKVGPPPASDSQDRRSIWQPRLIIEGKEIPGVLFEGWKTRWPKDNSELSERMIEIYLPQNSKKYPTYFPSWLQVSGLVGKAKVRIVDSGSNLLSPMPFP